MEYLEDIDPEDEVSVIMRSLFYVHLRLDRLKAELEAIRRILEEGDGGQAEAVP
jgi:hypothetical protein